MTDVADFPPLPVPQNQRRRFSTRNHAIRATAKNIAQSGDSHICHHAGLSCLAQSQNRAGEPLSCHLKGHKATHRPQIEKYLRNSEAFHRQRRIDSLPGTEVSISRHHSKASWGPSDEQEGRDIAHSDIAIPSDRHRRPSLERQDAFYDFTTARRRIRVAKPVPMSEDAQIAELYRAGILYDDNNGTLDDSGTKTPGAVFDLDSIRHDGFLYKIRGSKRARKNQYRNYQQLSLELSMTDLANDENIRHLLGDDFGEDLIQHQSPTSSQSSTPLRIVYEGPGSPVLDFDASQPPDLEDDFDHISDQELDDAPTQEVHETDADETWIVVGDGL